MAGPTRRASRTRIVARGRRQYLAERIGRALLEARTGSGRLQRDIADRAGVSQSFYSRIERGAGARTTLETLAACALVCDAQLAAFLEALPGATLPRDIEHVRRQQAVIAPAASGGWRAMPERPYPARSAEWLAALRDPDLPMPGTDGFAWTGSRETALWAARFG